MSSGNRGLSPRGETASIPTAISPGATTSRWSYGSPGFRLILLLPRTSSVLRSRRRFLEVDFSMLRRGSDGLGGL